MANFVQGLALPLNDPIRALITTVPGQTQPTQPASRNLAIQIGPTQPDFFTNQVGTVVRAALVSKLKGAVPGHYSKLIGSGPSFRSIFFPHYSPVNYENVVSFQTGLNDGWWGNFAVAVLCQSMYWQTSDIRKQLKINQINQAVNGNNATLRSKVVQLYSYVLLHDFLKYTGNLTEAKDQYIKNICTVEWVTYKKKQYVDGTWSNPQWEEFNHWAKLSALGASDTEITNTINKLKNLGLEIYPNVDATTWRSYTSPWLKNNGLSHLDIDSVARNGELESVFLPGPYPSSMKEGNSFEFTANSQPGNVYRQTPSSSCFSGNTLVLMEDGSLKAIKDITSGECVHTRIGSRKVAFVSTPPKSNRKMHSINGLDFGFTRAHPFLNGDTKSGRPQFLVVSPLDVLYMIPMLGYEGIGQLENGSTVLGYKSNATIAFDINKVEEKDIPDCFVYDLVLEPNSSGQFEYIIGSHDALFVVASELPVFHNASTAELAAAAIVLRIVSSCSGLHSTLYDKVGHDAFRSMLFWEMHKMSNCMFSIPINSSKGSSQGPLVQNKADFLDTLLEFLKVFSIDGSYNISGGISFEYFMASCFGRIASNLSCGYRIIPKDDSSADVLALTLFDVQLIASTLVDDVVTHVLVSMELNGATVEHNIEMQDHQGSRYGTKLNKVLYIPFGLPTKQVEINFQLVNSNKTTSLEASAHVNQLPFQGQHHYCVPVFIQSKEIGVLNMDARCLTMLEQEEEEKAGCTWAVDTDVCKYSDHICKIASNIYMELLSIV